VSFMVGTVSPLVVGNNLSGKISQSPESTVYE